ncbi:MAG TPA: PhaM family polyhydroxyalkanoate granule multifunctional regulatory protein [Usitatibacteraceae bacterium]|nr:PhaM family polyhydroxyalkanoate granule multifunctional regulatory protein [Usitatibacteraceae bacterium]
MTRPVPGGMPDYFSLFQSLLNPGAASAAQSPMEAMGKMLDPAEIDKKIHDLEVVLAWLRATTQVVDGSIQALKMQRDFLAGLSQAAKPADGAAQDRQATPAAFDPLSWAASFMPAPRTPAEENPPQPGTAKGRRTRKPRG